MKLLSSPAKKSLTALRNQWSPRIHLHCFPFTLLVNHHSWNYTWGAGSWTCTSTPWYKHTHTPQLSFHITNRASSVFLGLHCIYLVDGELGCSISLLQNKATVNHLWIICKCICNFNSYFKIAVYENHQLLRLPVIHKNVCFPTPSAIQCAVKCFVFCCTIIIIAH